MHVLIGCYNDITVNFFTFLYINSRLPRVSSVIDHRRNQNVVWTSVTHSPHSSCATLLIIPHFDIHCKLLLNRCTATWNLFVKQITELIMKLGSLRSYDGNCNENITLKLNFALSKLFCDYSMLVRLYKIGGVHFRLLGTSVFHVKLKNERFTAASSRCRQNLKYENFPSSFGRLRQNIAPKSVLHVQHDYFSSFNQSNYWFVALSLTLPSSHLKLPNILNG